MPVNLLTHWLTKQWFFNLFYNIFVKGPLYVVQRIGNVFSYLTGQQITNTVFNRHGDAFGMPHTYLVLLATAGVLMVLLGCLVILKAAMSSMVGKELGSLVRRFILVLIVVAMSSIIFFCANFLVSELILVVMPGDVNGKQLANQVGRIGFTDGKDHSS